MTGFKKTDSSFLQERGKGIGLIANFTYPPTPFQLEGGSKNCPNSPLKGESLF
jgi:hypothetical protein